MSRISDLFLPELWRELHLTIEIFSYSLGTYLGAEIMESVVTVFHLLTTTTLFSKMTTILHFHKECMRVSISPHRQYLLLSFFISHSRGHEMAFHLIFIFISLWLVMLSIFSCAYSPFVYPLEKCVYRSFAHFKNCLFTEL